MKVKVIILPLITLFFLNAEAGFTQQDITPNVIATLENGDSKKLSMYFSTTIDLTVPGKEGSFSKTQAELILRDFFSKHPITSFKVKHKGSSTDGSIFTIGTLITRQAKSFRTYFLLKKVSGKYYIQQLQIEKD